MAEKEKEKSGQKSDKPKSAKTRGDPVVYIEE